MLPEESIPAWQWAIDNGAQIVDMDTQITSDGKLAVMHDLTINRTTNRSGSVANVTLDYIKGAWLELPIDLNGNGDPDNTAYHPPSLNQALNFLNPKVNKVDGKPILISWETKGAGWSQAMLNRLFEVINGKGMKDRGLCTQPAPSRSPMRRTPVSRSAAMWSPPALPHRHPPFRHMASMCFSDLRSRARQSSTTTTPPG
jgi:hypothetical protein